MGCRVSRSSFLVYCTQVRGILEMTTFSRPVSALCSARYTANAQLPVTLLSNTNNYHRSLETKHPGRA